MRKRSSARFWNDECYTVASEIQPQCGCFGAIVEWFFCFCFVLFWCIATYIASHCSRKCSKWQNISACPILLCLFSSYPQIFDRMYLELSNEKTQWAWWKAGMRVGIFWTLQGESLSLLKWQTVDLLTNTFSSQCSWIGYLYGLVNFSRSLSYGGWPTTHPRHQLCFTTAECLKRKTAKKYDLVQWYFIDYSRWII